MKTKNIIVAIDGPAGSGKGTLAKILSERCNLLNIDTGATYRSLALACLNAGLTLDNKEEIIKLSENLDVKFGLGGKVFLEDKDVTSEIRTPEISQLSSFISSIVEVRKNMVDLQRKMAGDNDVVMEGRDITTVVFPNATYKIYLDADVEERAKRRVKQNKEKGIDTPYEAVLEDMKNRDYNDMNKEVGSLMRTNEQIYIDSTNISTEQVSEIVINIIKGSE